MVNRRNAYRDNVEIVVVVVVVVVEVASMVILYIINLQQGTVIL